MSGATEREIRDLLRQDAQRVPISDDMWEKVSARLDRAGPLKVYKGRQERRFQWRSAMTYVGVVALFWMTVLPAGLRTSEQLPSFPTASEGPASVETHPRYIEGAIRRPGVREWAARLWTVNPADNDPRGVTMIK